MTKVKCDGCGAMETTGKAELLWRELTMRKHPLAPKPWSLVEKNLCPACCEVILRYLGESLTDIDVTKCGKCGAVYQATQMWYLKSDETDFCDCDECTDDAFETLCDKCIGELCTHLTPKKYDTPVRP